MGVATYPATWFVLEVRTISVSGRGGRGTGSRDIQHTMAPTWSRRHRVSGAISASNAFDLIPDLEEGPTKSPSRRGLEGQRYLRHCCERWSCSHTTAAPRHVVAGGETLFSLIDREGAEANSPRPPPSWSRSAHT